MVQILTRNSIVVDDHFKCQVLHQCYLNIIIHERRCKIVQRRDALPINFCQKRFLIFNVLAFCKFSFLILPQKNLFEMTWWISGAFVGTRIASLYGFACIWTKVGFNNCQKENRFARVFEKTVESEKTITHLYIALVPRQRSRGYFLPDFLFSNF